ncbi:MAG: hypothetical protein KJN69_07405 [Gammaproteobacteria bacterium]|nr:hypothetical protein [Gammaproteobacteria bacterium]
MDSAESLLQANGIEVIHSTHSSIEEFAGRIDPGASGYSSGYVLIDAVIDFFYGFILPAKRPG